MVLKQLSEFGATAKSLARNPLGIIALFIVLVYGLACLVVITGGSLTSAERLPIIYFLVLFPLAVLSVFTYLVACKSENLYGPSDFRNDANFVRFVEAKTRVAAALMAAKLSKESKAPQITATEIDRVAKSAERAVNQAETSNVVPSVLWVDDNPSNNVYERRAFDALNFDIVLSETTQDALSLLRRRKFDAVISDMGRREGPREGYALLDAMRDGGDQTPLFFYAASSLPEHKEETRQHGGQGCTNDGQELFDMVTNAVFSPSVAGKARGVPRGRRRSQR